MTETSETSETDEIIDRSRGDWYVIQTLSNQEGKVKRYLDKFIVEEEMEDFVFEVLVPTETVIRVEPKNKSCHCMCDGLT